MKRGSGLRTEPTKVVVEVMDGGMVVEGRRPRGGGDPSDYIEGPADPERFSVAVAASVL